MTDIPIYADPEVMSQNMIIFAVSQSESLRVRKDQVLVGEVTIVPLVQGQAKPELAAVAEEVELLVATEARRRANSRPFRGRGATRQTAADRLERDKGPCAGEAKASAAGSGLHEE